MYLANFRVGHAEALCETNAAYTLRTKLTNFPHLLLSQFGLRIRGSLETVVGSPPTFAMHVAHVIAMTA